MLGSLGNSLVTIFLLLVLKKPIGKLTGWVCIVQAVLTGWLPGYLLLTVPGFG